MLLRQQDDHILFELNPSHYDLLESSYSISRTRKFTVAMGFLELPILVQEMVSVLST